MFTQFHVFEERRLETLQLGLMRARSAPRTRHFMRNVRRVQLTAAMLEEKGKEQMNSLPTLTNGVQVNDALNRTMHYALKGNLCFGKVYTFAGVADDSNFFYPGALDDDLSPRLILPADYTEASPFGLSAGSRLTLDIGSPMRVTLDPEQGDLTLDQFNELPEDFNYYEPSLPRTWGWTLARGHEAISDAKELHQALDSRWQPGRRNRHTATICRDLVVDGRDATDCQKKNILPYWEKFFLDLGGHSLTSLIASYLFVPWLPGLREKLWAYNGQGISPIHQIIFDRSLEWGALWQLVYAGFTIYPVGRGGAPLHDTSAFVRYVLPANPSVLWTEEQMQSRICMMCGLSLPVWTANCVKSIYSLHVTGQLGYPGFGHFPLERAANFAFCSPRCRQLLLSFFHLHNFLSKWENLKLYAHMGQVDTVLPYLPCKDRMRHI